VLAAPLLNVLLHLPVGLEPLCQAIPTAGGTRHEQRPDPYDNAAGLYRQPRSSRFECLNIDIAKCGPQIVIGHNHQQIGTRVRYDVPVGLEDGSQRAGVDGTHAANGERWWRPTAGTTCSPGFEQRGALVNRRGFSFHEKSALLELMERGEHLGNAEVTANRTRDFTGAVPTVQ
jgi:hypothetical protein